MVSFITRQERLGKAKITDRINRIFNINLVDPVNPVENRHEKFFVSGTEKVSYQQR